MNTHLLQTICRAGLGDTDSIRGLSAAIGAEWTALIPVLRLHRLLPFSAYAVRRAGANAALPEDARALLDNVYRQTRLLNATFMKSLGDVLHEAQAAGVDPTVWKGAALLNTMYPDLGAREMDDIDLALPPAELARLEAACRRMGFEHRPEFDTEDAVHYVKATGVAFDVHHRVRLFEGRDESTLTMEVPGRHLRVTALRVLEPNALTVLLTAHMLGHRPQMGYQLRWLIDLAHVVHHEGSSLRLERIRELLPTAEALGLLLRSLGFVRDGLGVRLPEPLQDATRGVAPLTFAEVVRQRHLAVWGLPTLRGCVRVSLCRLGVRPPKHESYPSVNDLLHWAADRHRERRAVGLAAGTPRRIVD